MASTILISTNNSIHLGQFRPSGKHEVGLKFAWLAMFELIGELRHEIVPPFNLQQVARLVRETGGVCRKHVTMPTMSHRGSHRSNHCTAAAAMGCAPVISNRLASRP